MLKYRLNPSNMCRIILIKKCEKNFVSNSNNLGLGNWFCTEHGAVTLDPQQLCIKVRHRGSYL